MLISAVHPLPVVLQPPAPQPQAVAPSPNNRKINEVSASRAPTPGQQQELAEMLYRRLLQQSQLLMNQPERAKLNTPSPTQQLLNAPQAQAAGARRKLPQPYAADAQPIGSLLYVQA